ncbi:glycosyltransferase family 4 protein [Clostridium perfringens]|uniref:glycosyltransferase family 4 protein n=1 Tax=Clostridium perfringens TaxID=1502 RepID=UPI0024BD5598|nr:glycosyltransferase family 4 protein [Clostridium perfringens]EIF6290039.1 glycosyltransferase family 4 protein [Clostridium perfringens]EJT6534362.1 glycosyltransferase family 4 protein [Clostridium perfringens]MDM0780045.1 glycosyltransferase family 4 protein [Clostridium perfringens]MDM0791861.1 glycosyltransferase family 4 protein [Clostridium perfringens]MDM0816025.1 glycosyltransferase family 4 protein [Clostridium perfringens]
MKNILYLHAGAELYGADIVLLELLKNINKNKYNPYVVLPCNGPLVNKLRENNINVEVIEYPILRRKYFNPIGMVNYIKDYIKYSNRLKNICKREKIDFIHTNTTAVLEGVYLKKKLSIPHIWHIHEIIVKPKFIHKFLSFIVSRYSDEVVTVSKAVKGHLDKTGYFKKEINVIYNGVDNSVFKKSNEIDYLRKEFKIPDNSFIVGMIGRINAWKGQSDFLDAMELVLENNKDTYAMLVGGVFEGEEWRFAKLKEKISSMKNNERVILSDYRSDTKNIHALYDIFVLPSTNPDPLPTVVLESMATAKPIVGYRHGGICEMVKENYNGKLATPNDYNDLAKKIQELIDDDNLRNNMGENSLKRQCEIFSLKSYSENFINLYEKIKK